MADAPTRLDERKKRFLLSPGIEPGSMDSESTVITPTLREPNRTTSNINRTYRSHKLKVWPDEVRSGLGNEVLEPPPRVGDIQNSDNPQRRLALSLRKADVNLREDIAFRSTRLVTSGLGIIFGIWDVLS